jgi:RimJ/RimL family protein N-acetyltransferase
MDGSIGSIGSIARTLVLANEVVELRPMVMGDAGALAEALADAPETFAYFPPPYAPEPGEGITREVMERFIAGRLADATCVAFTVVERASGQVVGGTCYLDIRPRHRGVEIGATFYAKRVRGTKINPACKRLLLGYAFEEAFGGDGRVGCERVQLKCDGRNVASRGGIEKLGARFEGTLRKHMVMHGGFVRDTLMYSIVRDEWARVREGLDQRLG